MAAPYQGAGSHHAQALGPKAPPTMAACISGALMALNLARHTVCCPGGPGRIHFTVLSITCRMGWGGGTLRRGGDFRDVKS